MCDRRIRCPRPDHYDSRFLVAKALRGSLLFFFQKESPQTSPPPSPLAPTDFDKTQSKLPFRLRHAKPPRFPLDSLNFDGRTRETRRFVRLDSLHWNCSLFLILVHAFVRGRNTERGKRSIGSRIRRSLGPPPTTRFRDPFSFIYHCLLRHFHDRPVERDASISRDRWKESEAREGSPRPDSAVLQGRIDETR